MACGNFSATLTGENVNVTMGAGSDYTVDAGAVAFLFNGSNSTINCTVALKAYNKALVMSEASPTGKAVTLQVGPSLGGAGPALEAGVGRGMHVRMHGYKTVSPEP